VGWGLYDLRDDGMEAQNLFGSPAVAREQATLQKALNKLKARATKGCFDKAKP
jgi:hypothetical protein